MVSFGESTGAPGPISVSTLNAKGSLFLTRPGLAAHATELGEYHQRADAVFKALTAGVIKSSVWNVFSLSDVAAAHSALEEGRSAGAILLKP
jgi:NADPH2:quinone reductase